MLRSAPLIHFHRAWWDVLQPVLDACAVIASFAAIRVATGTALDETSLSFGLIAAVSFLLAGQVIGLYRIAHGTSVDRELGAVALTWVLATSMLAIYALASDVAIVDSIWTAIAWLLVAPSLVGVCRMALRVVQQGLLRNGVGARRVAIAGWNELGRHTAENLRSDASLGWRFVGYYDDRPIEREPSPPPVSDHSSQESDATLHASSLFQGDLIQLVADARAGRVDTVLVTLPMRAEQRIRFVLEGLSDSTASVYIIPDFFVFELLHSRWTDVGGVPAVSIFENPFYGVDGLAKRITDVVVGGISLLVAAIPMLMIAAAIKLTSPGPIFFRQRRYGLDGREIRVWKFRSMRVCDDGAVVRQATQGDLRITPLGRLLRKTSLDELPQLFNVLAGNMSLVGPRPHAAAHNELYRGQIRGYMLRHKVKPGITGLAQVNGCRGETDTLEKMRRRIELDHQYIRAWSLWLDFGILFRTLIVAWRQPEAR